MCYTELAMYEGKNIHYSAVDNKPLCSFSRKLCNQRRLNNYAFCVRHILEDPTAPFKRCAYVAKSSGQTCTQPIPNKESRVYCNNHMQVLGLLPRKERKQKPEKDVPLVNSPSENKLSFEDRVKNKFNITSNPISNHSENSFEDPEDPYAFPEPVLNGPITSTPSAITPTTTLSVEIPASTVSNTMPSKSPTDSGGSSIAKMFPELAEKLEKPRMKIESNKMKGKVKSSRTMNQLQTKIAQNRIKDKIKKSQEVSTAGYNSLPFQLPLEVPSFPFSDLKSPVRSQPPPPTTTDSPLNSPIDLRTTVTGASKQVGSSSIEPYSLGFHPLHSPVNNLSPVFPPKHVLPPPPPYPGFLDLGPSLTQTTTSVPSLLTTVPPRTSPVSTTYSQSRTKTSGFDMSGSSALLALSRSHLPPPPPYVAPAPVVSVPKLSVLTAKPRKLKDVLSAQAAKQKLKTDSAVKCYSYHVRKRSNNHCLHSSGILSSDDSDVESDDDLLPWQRDWFAASSDEEMNEDDDDPSGLLSLQLRTTKLALLRAQVRRQCAQSRKAYRSNIFCQKYDNHTTTSLISAIREKASAAVKMLHEIHGITKKPVDKYKTKGLEERQCCHKNEEDVQCQNKVLPCTNHCIKHVMYNVDQQLFDYCTAKFADNTQCCVPVFDIKHELPLCQEHGAKADNYKRSLDTEDKPKRPRKKTKPSALTRPFKRGKKKKNRRVLRPQKPSPPTEPVGGLVPNFSTERLTIEKSPSPGPEQPSEKSSSEDESKTIEAVMEQDLSKSIVRDLTTEDLNPLSAGPIDDRALIELPLEQASRLLEESDFQEVFNKIPYEAFDIFSGKNGEFEPSSEEIEQAFMAASRDVRDTGDSVSKAPKGYELTDDDLKQINDTLQNIQGSNIELNHESINAIARSLAAADLQTPTDLQNQNISDSDLKYKLPSQMPNSLAQLAVPPPQSQSNHSLVTTTNHMPLGGFPVNSQNLYGIPSSVPTDIAVNQATSAGQYSTSGAIPVYPGSQTRQVPLPPNHIFTSISSSVQLDSRTQENVPAHIQQVSPHVGNSVNMSGRVQQSPISNYRQMWTSPVNTGQSGNFQNGFPMNQAVLLQGASFSGAKFHSNAQHGNSDIKSDLSMITAQLQHSIRTPGIGASLQGFIQSQTVNNTLPPYSAANGS